MTETLTEALDNLYTTTWRNQQTTLTDNIFDGSPFWFWMKANKALQPEEGGKFIVHPLRFAKSDRVAFIGKGGTVSLNDQEFLTDAIYEWRYLTDSIVRFGVDDQKNRGKHKIMSLLEAKLAVSKDTLIDQMETSIFGAQATLSFEGLQDLVADDPTAAATVGGIPQDAAANSWWRNQTKDMAGLSFAINGNAEMRTMLNDCGKNLRGDTPNIIVSGQTPFEFYEDSVGEQKRIVNQKLGDAGFENIQFKGIPMIWSPSCANTRMYFLNTRFLRFIFDPMFNFEMTEWKAIPDQVNDKAAQIILAGNLVTSRRRVHGVLHTIDTA